MYASATATALFVCMVAFGQAGYSQNDVIDIKAYGAKGGAHVLTDAGIEQGDLVLQSVSPTFSSVDIGKIVEIPGAGDAGGKLVAKVVGVKNANSVLLDTAAKGTVRAARAVIAADDFEPVQRAISAAIQKRLPLIIPRDTYYTHSGWTVDGPLTIAGNDSQIIVGTGNAFQIKSPPNDVTAAGITIKDVSVDGDIYLDHARDVTLSNVRARGVTVVASSRVSIEKLWISSQAPATVGIQVSGHSTGITILNYHFRTIEPVPGMAVPLRVSDHSEVAAHDIHIDTAPGLAQDLSVLGGEFEYDGASYSEPKSTRKLVYLQPNMTNVGIGIPDGVTRQITFTIKDRDTLKRVTALCGGCPKTFENDLTPGLPRSGTTAPISGINWVGTIGPQFKFNEKGPSGLTGKTIRVTTGANVKPGDFLLMEIEYYPVPFQSWQKPAQFIAALLFALAGLIAGTRAMRSARAS